MLSRFNAPLERFNFMKIARTRLNTSLFGQKKITECEEKKVNKYAETNSVERL